jgi:hypothetical protein
VATVVRMRSTKREPRSLSVPKQPLRHITAGRMARSPTLFVDGRQKTYRFDQAEAGSGQGLAGRSVVR